MNHSEARGSPTSSILIVTVALAASSLFAWQQRSRLESARSTYDTQFTRLGSLQADADRLVWLRNAPQRATDRRVPHDQLVAEIEQACDRASLQKTSLTSIWPETPRRLEQSDYQESSTRLSFERVDLKQVSAFVYHLQTIDPSLGASELQLTAPKANEASWDVELTVSYLLFSPRREN